MQSRGGKGRAWGEVGTHYPGPDYVACVFVFFGIVICRLYKLTLSGQEQVILKLTFFLVYCKDLCRSAFFVGALGGEGVLGGGQKIFPPEPEPALVGPEDFQHRS